MDPIKDGGRIFKRVSDEFQGKPVSGIKNIKKFFDTLLLRTKGLVILDFLDMANWDRIEAFSIDEESGLLTLIWQDYRDKKESPDEKEMREMVFPASLYSLGIYIKSIVPISGETSAIFLINGYAKTVKAIKKMYCVGADEIKVFDNRFFEKRVVRKVGDHFEVIDVHCTPIYSLVIIPKNFGFSSGDSKDLLYRYNLENALKRISNVVKVLDQLTPSDEDDICEKIITARRTLELVLKIECCYKNLDIKGDYSKVLLGQLATTVKKAKDDNFKILLNKMSQWLNEFSHDSGIPIDLDKAKLAATLVLAYTKLFEGDVSIKSRF